MDSAPSTPVWEDLPEEQLVVVDYPSPTTQYKEVIDQPPVSLLDLPDEEDDANVSMEEIIIEE